MIWFPVDKIRWDFSQFHPLDHWPLTRRCRAHYGGARRHLYLAWIMGRRDQWFGWWFRLAGCRLKGKHAEVLWHSGKRCGVGCLYCDWTRLPTELERASGGFEFVEYRETERGAP